MDQVKVGIFLKQLRKEKELTQEQLAEKLRVSNRTISRWETGSNMPDISMLVEIADFYAVSIPEIICGERKGESMNQETRETAGAMAEYSQNALKREKKKTIAITVGILLAAFGLLTIIAALSTFPSDSSWGSIYSVAGGLLTVIGLYFTTRSLTEKRGLRAFPLQFLLCQKVLRLLQG